MHVEVGEQGYSHDTPGSDFEMWCEEERWEYIPYESEEHYRECVLSAPRCTDFAARQGN